MATTHGVVLHSVVTDPTSAPELKAAVSLSTAAGTSVAMKTFPLPSDGTSSGGSMAGRRGVGRLGGGSVRTLHPATQRRSTVPIAVGEREAAER